MGESLESEERQESSRTFLDLFPRLHWTYRMLERFLRVFIFFIYLFDTVFARQEDHNKGKDLVKKIMNRPTAGEGIRLEQFVSPS